MPQREDRTGAQLDADRAELARLEAVAFGSWPASEVVAHQGMLLRATQGDSRRARSAALHACDPDLNLESAIATAEAFYRARRMPPLFQIGPLAPPGIDEALAARDYTVEAPVSAQTAPLEDVVHRAEGSSPPAGGVATSPAVSAEVLAQPDTAWIEVQVVRGRYAATAGVFVGLMKTLVGRAGFGVVRVAGAIAGAGLFVQDGDVLFAAAMRTVHEQRRRGAARALLHAGAAWGLARGAKTAYLQVEHDNQAAIGLYSGAGFVTRYGYHYRELR
jgi:ribosomal protein S18 acetylase RimI-like enzyme